MPRLRQVPRKDVTDPAILQQFERLFGPDRDPVESPGTRTGTAGNWWTVFANSPATLVSAMQGFDFYLKGERSLDPVLRELGQTRAGYLNGSQFVYSQHCKSCRGIGMPEAKIEGIKYWEVSDAFDERERALLAYTDCLVLRHGRVPEEIFAKVKTVLTDEQILEFTWITCMYNSHAIISRALRLEFDDRDDPIVEVAAPETFAGRNFLE
jgi:alkylhydroperoxidase family enzyme